MAWKKHCPYCGGALGVKNLDDRERKVCLICGRLIYENPVPAVAVVVFDDCKRVLLVRRGVEPGKGKWSLPGGFIELDETPYETARRELFEETMLEASGFSLVDVFVQDNPVYDKVLLLGFIAIEPKGAPKAGDDAIDARYFELDKLPDIAFKSHIALIEKAREIKQ